MIWMLWMMTDMKSPLPENIKKALDYHTKKYGLPPNVLEYSNQLSGVPNFDGVESTAINFPKNLLLIGVKR